MKRMRRLAFYLWMPYCPCSTCMRAMAILFFREKWRDLVRGLRRLVP